MLRTYARNLIDVAMRAAAEIGWIINQSPGELSAAAVEIASIEAATVLEIGCQHGGWMFAVRPFCASTLRYIAVDPAFSTGWPVCQKLLKTTGVEICEIRRTSQAALPAVKAALAWRAVDVLHIDGSHVAADALHDFDVYGPLVRAGGLVLMHDVCGSQGPGDALFAILHSARTARIRESLVVCDTWARPEPERMGIAILRF